MEIKVHTDELVSVMQAAATLKLARFTVYRWIAEGRLVGIKLGGTMFVPTTEIERLQKKEGTA